MKQFVSKFILFVFLFLLYMGGNYIVNLHYINSNIPEEKLNDYNTLIMGDSHPQMALNPSLFDSAYNMCQDAEPYFVTYWKLKKLLTQYKTIDTVLLGFSFHNISAFNDKKLNDRIWSTEMFKRIYPIEELKTLKNIKIDWLEYYTIMIKKMCLYPVKNHTYYIGEYKKSQMNNVSDYDISIKRHYYYNDRNVGISAVAIDFLKSIIALCKKNHIMIGLVTTPLHEEYIKRIPANFKREFLQLKHELKNNDLLVLDYSSIALDDSVYLNSDHLNESGAKKFTKIVIDSLQHHL